VSGSCGIYARCRVREASSLLDVARSMAVVEFRVFHRWVRSHWISARATVQEEHGRESLKAKQGAFHGGPVNKNLPLFLCLLIRN
jgi:hypothetical protein